MEKSPDLKFTVEPLEEKHIVAIVPILMEHVKDRETGEIIEAEVEMIQSYMRGISDSEGKARKFFVASGSDGEVLGCMAYSCPDADMLRHFSTSSDESVEVLNAFVSSKVYRGRGVGKALFRRICEEAKAEGKKMVLVHSGPRYKNSWGFYDKVCDENKGFLVGKYGEGGDAKTWLKRLDV